MSVVVTADPTKGVKLDAAVIAAPFREEIRKRVQELKQQGLGTCVLTTAGPIFLRQNLGKKLPAMLHHHLIHFFWYISRYSDCVRCSVIGRFASQSRSGRQKVC